MKIIRIDKWNIFEIFIQIYMYFSLHEEKNEKKKKRILESLFLNELVKLTQAQESPLSQMNEKSAEGWKLIFHLFY